MDDKKILSSMEIDAIGEILNISLGSAATAISNMLGARVDITTPIVRPRRRSDFEMENIEPAVGVEIAYSEGIVGDNVMVLKRDDVRAIVGMLMGMEIPDEEFVMDEITSSAIGEVMNQMMGASATALSELLSRVVDITTPVCFEVEGTESFKDKYFGTYEVMIEIRFTLKIGDNVESEFLNLIPVDLAKEIVVGFGIIDAEEEEAETLLAPVVETPAPVVQEVPVVAEAAPVAPVVEVPVAAPAPVAPAPVPVAPVPVQQPVAQAPVQYAAPVQSSPQFDQLAATMNQMMEMMRMQMGGQAGMGGQGTATVRDPKTVKVGTPPRPNLHQMGVEDGHGTNLELVKKVPVEVSVEIGRTKKFVRDILEFNKGSVVVLDKIAGEHVDLFVNGQCIAQGDVVVVDDSFAIRITEILSREAIADGILG